MNEVDSLGSLKIWEFRPFSRPASNSFSDFQTWKFIYLIEKENDNQK